MSTRYNVTEARLGWRLICTVALIMASAHLALAAPTRPNVVLLLADDLGWSDLGCYGTDLQETPHIDRLAREGVRFTQAYAMPVCSPTRASILTGRHAGSGSTSQSGGKARLSRRMTGRFYRPRPSLTCLPAR